MDLQDMDHVSSFLDPSGAYARASIQVLTLSPPAQPSNPLILMHCTLFAPSAEPVRMSLGDFGWQQGVNSCSFISLPTPDGTGSSPRELYT
jgi:hypothetical protein